MSAVARFAVSVPIGVVLVLALAGGCVHRVTLVSHPAAAYVTVGETRAGVAPVELEVPLFGERRVSVQRSGFRTVDLRLPFLPPREIEVRLVPEHGGAGSWDPEDID